VDRNQIELALLNVCTNARDAMPDGGTLLIETSHIVVEDDHEGHAGVKSGEYIQILTTDTGTGIPKRDIDRIFDPFFTTKEPDRGTGLGLSVTLGTIKNHGGSIRATSRLNEGTVIKILLPASGSRRGTPAKPPGKGIVEGTGTILVIDDERQVLEVVARVLKKAGYKTVAARGGEEMANGIVQYVQKPYSITKLCAVIQETLTGG